MERGVVVETDGGRVLVEAGLNDTCCDCPAGSCCMMAASGGKRRLWMDNGIGAGAGDEVSFFIEGGAAVAGSVMVYGMPAVMLIAGIVAGLSLAARLGAEPEAASIAGGAIGLIMSYVIVAIISSAIKKRGLYVPRLVEVTGRKTN